LPDRIRKDSIGWDGIRQPFPPDFDFGQIRFALGFLYWKDKDWATCVRALAPFVSDPDLAKSVSRGKALFMLGKSCYRLGDLPNGVKALKTLSEVRPDFEAMEEVLADTASWAMTLKDWPTVVQMHTAFVSRFPSSVRRPYIDLYSAVASMEIPERFNTGFSLLNSLARSKTYRDVKAEALFRQGMFMLATAARDEKGVIDNSDYRKIATKFAASLEVFPQPAVCLEAARCKVALCAWDEAKQYLDQILRDFPDAAPPLIEAANQLLIKVKKELASLPTVVRKK
jgi:tetratricopeptide (TPR) repeat protein